MCGRRSCKRVSRLCLPRTSLTHRSACEEQVGRIRNAPLPSEIIKSARTIEAVFRGKTAIIRAGRPSGNYGPPTALFHPTLAKLKKYLGQPDQIEVSHNYINHSRDYIELSADTYRNETSREENLRKVVKYLVGSTGKWQEETELGTAEPDVTFILQYPKCFC